MSQLSKESLIAKIKSTGTQVSIGAKVDELRAIHSRLFPTVKQAAKSARDWDLAVQSTDGKRVELIDQIAYAFIHRSPEDGIELATAILTSISNKNARELRKELASNSKRFTKVHKLDFFGAPQGGASFVAQPKVDPNKDIPYAQCHSNGTALWDKEIAVLKMPVRIAKIIVEGEAPVPVVEGEGKTPVVEGGGETPVVEGEGETPVVEGEGETPAPIVADISPAGQELSDEEAAAKSKADAMIAVNEALDTLAGDWRALMLVYNNVADAISRLSDEDRLLMEQASS